MSVLNRIEGNLQYQSVNGATAALYLTTWVLTHSGNTRTHENNGHSLITLIPPHAEGCLTQLNIEYHFENSTQAEFLILFDELTAAIYHGTAAPFAPADCDSGWGNTDE